MTEKKDELKAETIDPKMPEEFAANINRQVTEKPPQVEADTSEKERLKFPSAAELGKAFAAAINRAVMEEKRERERLATQPISGKPDS